METKNTPRGFEIIEFKDQYGNRCSLQQSSLAIYEIPGTSAIWFGTCNRMHLSRELLSELMPHLQNWLEHGSFESDSDN